MLASRTKTATITFIQLSLLASAAGAVQLPSAVVSDGLGANIHYLNPTGQGLDMTQAADCKFVRMDLTWASLESSTPGTYNFADADTLYNACAARGIRINFILDYDNPLVYPTDHNSDTWRQAFTNYATAAASHFKGEGVLWELWNEPDGNFGPAVQYMALAQQVIPAMRQADSGCTIVAPALSGITSVTNTSYLQSCIQQGLLNLVDAVSVHPYRATNPETVVSDYAAVRTMMQTYGGKTMPIVSSEWGYSCARDRGCIRWPTRKSKAITMRDPTWST